MQGTTAVIPAPADHSGDGPQTVSYKSCDAAGNWELVKTVVVRIDTIEDTFDDTTPPEVTAFSITPTVFDADRRTRPTDHDPDRRSVGRGVPR